MPRFRLEVEFDGTGFVGWQRQAAGRSVQGALEEAFESLVGVAVAVHGAGRTDAGVHALSMTAHADLPPGARILPPDRLQSGLNHFLRPQPIAVLAVARAADDFHARFSATARHYRYVVLNRRAPPVLDAGRVWHVSRAIDAGVMADEARALLGRHDFTSFRSTECQAASAIKTLDRLTVRREGATIVVEASARSFLHHQVRNMVGTLVLVGEGRRPRGFAAEALAARDRVAAGPTAPARGLYFVRAIYA